MNFSLQPVLENDLLKLQPLTANDFEKLYAVASDPEVWAMHPNKERYKREVFQNFFNGAFQSGGAFLILDKKSDEVLGSTRFYDYNEKEKTILIGYTFYGTKSWGKNINSSVKKMMLDYIFQFVDRVIFHVGKNNIRSVKAMNKLGAENKGEEEVAYFGEDSKTNIIFEIKKEDWQRWTYNDQLPAHS
ncbi:GNAT family N-acetyltransferase [Kaistella palustris]|uniref:GNAT family N-acetyltransferase n=1 Tax=Kaistella palustris TaxID=493376 RepID=UPI00041D0061|nr:GNAT family N-acetyltransferase [Kaistella palustris]